MISSQGAAIIQFQTFLFGKIQFYSTGHSVNDKSDTDINWRGSRISMASFETPTGEY